jgi:tetratricopeptide (TPR) repeat protein
MRTIAPALALLVGALSALVADPTAALERLSDEVRAVRGANRPLPLSGRGNEAVLALIQDAERELSAGRPEQAAVALERALRIEPRNPTVWHYLGLARLDLGDYAQAEVMASRSHSLAPADRTLRAYNSRLVATARQASGQTAAPLPNGLEAWASRDTFDTGVEQPSRYSDGGDGRQRSVRGQQRVRRAPVEEQVRVEPGAQAPAWRARADGGTDRVRREPLQRECRIWYPDRPPNRQPPPFSCDERVRQVPPGAVLLVSI